MKQILSYSVFALAMLCAASVIPATAQNSASDGYLFEQQWKNTSVPTPFHNYRQGFGCDDQFYIQDKGSDQKKIHVYGSGGFVEDLPVTTGLGSNFTCDQAGNMLVRLGQYQRPMTANAEIRLISPDGSTTADISFPDADTRPLGRSDHWGFVKGDVFSAEGARLVVGRPNTGNIYVIDIKNGALDQCKMLELPFLFSDAADREFASDDYVSHWVDAAGRDHFLAVHRSDNPIDLTFDGDNITANTIRVKSYSNFGTSNGVNCFALAGKNYIMFSTQPNWNDGFVIAELGTTATGDIDGESVNVVAWHDNSYASSLGTDDSSCNNWLNAETTGDRSAYIYQYFPGYYTAKYLFTVQEETPTAVETVRADDATNVTYVNAQGQSSVAPFNGFNVAVTRHADGTTTVEKLFR
ncbi:MAG: hypothetical protein IJT30_04750 [Muribaculaceae bacterium]|nr:hypothetical protein [Muribaculaceae bacterium]